MTTMPNLTLKNVPEELLVRLRTQAESNRRSLNSEILVLLDAALAPHKPDVDAMLEAVDALHATHAVEPMTPAEIRRAIRRGRL
ncbi:MAG TPA: Arc family DNA-binding protein [Candidatus Krumholzibacteria bacterium]|jgi:plasmid stability protein|nr:Arc family DNA-binding protein [Candidatus Krumholzibacteria bacterium]